MLNTIQELEREIEQFHKNVKDSNELMKILKSVASLTKSQTESFEVCTQSLQDELTKLPPELSTLFKKEIEEFILEIRNEHQSYQTAVSSIMERYAEKLSAAEGSICKIPAMIDTQNEAAHKKYMEEIERVGTANLQVLTGSIEQHAAKLNDATDAIKDVPETLEAHLQKDRSDNIANLQQIQEQYAAELAKTNDAFSKQLQDVIVNIQAVPDQIKEDAAQQYSAFLRELDKVMDARMAQLSETEKYILALSKQLESKYKAFITKLETTNMDQLYKYSQDMNKSLNTKLGIALGGIAVAVIVSIISLFI